MLSVHRFAASTAIAVFFSAPSSAWGVGMEECGRTLLFYGLWSEGRKLRKLLGEARLPLLEL